MKKKVLLFFLAGFVTANAQVGIKTENPTRTLDVDGNMRIRDLKFQDPKMEGFSFLTADDKGNIGRKDVDIDHIALGAEQGTGKQEISAVKGQLVSADLTEMAVTATIPANKKITLIVSYSLPIGSVAMSSIGSLNSRYYGVTFHKKMVDNEMLKDEMLEDMTRKFTATNSKDWDMISITNQYVETFNPSPVMREVTYYLKGFVDYIDGVVNTKDVRFKMFDPGRDNYNWGDSYISYEVLEVTAK